MSKTTSLFSYLQKTAMQQIGCNECDLAYAKLHDQPCFSIPELCLFKEFHAFYCPITGQRLGWTKEPRGLFFDEDDLEGEQE